jgi:hypothetical protein
MMEVLGRQKPDQRLAELVADDWAERGWMRVGNVAADWRDRRCRVQVAIDLGAPPFLDVDDAETLQRLDEELRPQLDAWGVDQLDTGVIRARDRRVTRLIADWVWAFRSDDEPYSFAGIRYVSRLDSSMECWAVFDDVEVREMSRTAIAPRTPTFFTRHRSWASRCTDDAHRRLNRRVRHQHGEACVVTYDRTRTADA